MANEDPAEAIKEKEKENVPANGEAVENIVDIKTFIREEHER
jgi:hypothetical protein